MRPLPIACPAGFVLVSLCVYLIGRSEPPVEPGPPLAPAVRTLGQRYGGKYKSLESRTKVKRDGKEVILVKYRWADPHHSGIVKWEGDTAYLDPKAEERLLDVTLRIDPERLEAAKESFGVGKAWLEGGPGAADPAGWIAQAARRGIVVKFEEGRKIVSVDHPWVVRHSTADAKPAAEALTHLWKVKAYSTKRELLAVMASFCQWMEYKTPSSERTNAAGETVITTGVTMPLETLDKGEGDCDTKSLLFASILANVPDQHLVFLTGQGHLFVGVRAVPRKGDHFVEIQGARYLLIEMTSPWPIGRVPGKQMTGWEEKSFRVTRIL